MDSSSQTSTVLRLFPEPVGSVELHGLYLDEPLRPAGTPAQPFVYANFIASIDGRISLPDPKTNRLKPPGAITNPRDWRLFQELTASADVLVTSGRYIRDLAAGDAQDSLPVSGKPEFADLLAWREQRGLTPQPAVAIVTSSLDLPIPKELLQSGRPVYVATGSAADPSHVKKLSAQGVRVLTAGAGTHVKGRALIDALSNEGFGNINMIGGAVLLNMLLADKALDRLYLTTACRILGGTSFDTLFKGDQLHPAADFTLRSLCYDMKHGDSIEQLFAAFDCVK